MKLGLAFYFASLSFLFWAPPLMRYLIQWFKEVKIRPCEQNLDFLRWWKEYYPFEKSKSELLRVKKYKFYTSLIFDLINFQRLYGSCPRQSFEQLRHGLLKEKEFNSKIKDIKMGAYTQFGLILMLVWSLILASKSILELTLDIEVLIKIGFLQLSGPLFFEWIQKVIFINRFKKFNAQFSCFYRFSSFYKSGLSMTQTLSNSNILELNLAQELKSTVEKMVNRWRKSGLCIKKDIDEIIDEIWFQRLKEFERFLQIITYIKLFTLVFFFLSSYFFYLVHLMNSMI